MRLLVYGGNQYNERRRIGEWPEAVTGQTLQNKYGVSELYASFGVGVPDEDPFLIYRVMQVYNQRSYPLTLLLDPGARVWEEFDWNGAALMLALFGAVDSPGRTLLQEPERYHSTEHLEMLFEGVARKAAEGQAVQPFLQVWAGSVLEDSPVVVPSEELVGLDSRPSLRDAAALLESLPTSLRCGRGWLIGGNGGYAAPLGVRLIFDNGKSVAPDSDEANGLLAVRERGAKFLSLLDPSDAGQSVKGDDLRTLTERPVFLWERELSHPFESFVADLNLLMALNDEAAARDAPSVRRPDALDQKFREVNDRLAERGPLGDSIAATAYKLLLDDTGTLTPQQTHFYLGHIFKSGAKKLDKSAEPRLDDAAALEFFVGERIYPSAAGARMPERYRALVCRRLFETEPDASELARTFKREAQHIDPDALRGLIDLGVRLSAASERGLGVWRPYSDDPEIGELVTQYVQTYARVGLREVSPTTLGNYLLFGDDPGGKWLHARFDEDHADGAEVIDAVVNFLLDKLKGEPDGEGRLKAAEWLTSLAHTELRPRVGIEEKGRIASALGGDWANLLLLRKAFRGEEAETKRRRKGAPAAPGDGELRDLAGELRDLAERWRGAALDFVPDVGKIFSLLGSAHINAVVGSLSQFAPPLSGSGGARWVEGWLALSKAAGDEKLRDTCRKKFEEEWVRQLLESRGTPLDMEVFAGLGETARRHAFLELLYGGGEGSDEVRRSKLASLLRTDKGSVAVRALLSDAYEAGKADASKRTALLRRYGRNPEAFGLLKEALGGEAAEEINGWLKKQDEDELGRTKDALKHLFISEPSGEFHERLKALKDATSKKFFTPALDSVVAEIIAANGDGAAVVLDAAPDEALKLIKLNLSPPYARQFEQMLDARALGRKAQDFERLLYGPAGDDEEARRACVGALNSQSAALDEIVVAAVEKGLAEPERRGVMFRRFFPAESKKRESRPKLLASIEELFEHLPEPLRGGFVETMFEHYGGEGKVERNDFVVIAYGIFGDLRREVDERGGNDLKGPKARKGKAFSDTVLRFVNSNELVRRRIATWAFDSETSPAMKRYLKDHPPTRAGVGAPLKTAAGDVPAAEGHAGEANGQGTLIQRMRERLKKALSDE